MSLVLQKDLPISVLPVDNNPEGNRFQATLKEIAKDHILIYASDIPPLAGNAKLSVEFRVEKHDFSFESSLKERQGQLLHLNKPKTIHKNRIRDTRRILYELPIHYTMWTETGRFESKIVDISEDGIRMSSTKALKKGTLISLDFYIKAERLRVITQGLVVWCVRDKENDYLFETGVQFTTISNEAKKKLAKYIEKLAETEGAAVVTSPIPEG